MAPSGSTTIMASGAASTNCQNQSAVGCGVSIGIGNLRHERGTGARIRHGDGSAVGLDGDLAERQSETATDAIAVLVGAPVVAIEDLHAKLGRDAAARVGDTQDDTRFVATRSDGDRGAARRVPDRVLDEVLEDAAKERFV